MDDMLVLATNNRHKLMELKQVLKNFPVTVKAVADFPPLPEPIEDGATFDDNARKKAVHYARLLNLPCMADDSGLVVDGLGGRPGVHSARYAGFEATDRQNCDKLLREMAGQADRTAHFVCVLTLAVPNGRTLSWQGSCHGQIIAQPRGDSGFGYDPLFFYPRLGKTLAEIPLEEKSAISHRGQAFARFAAEFETVRAWLRRQLAAP